MDSRVAFGSHSHILQPTTLLLKECQNINEKYHNSQDPNIQTLLSLIPSFDPLKLDNILSDIKASNFKTVLKQNGFDYNLIDSTIFSKYPFLSDYTDIQVVLIFLHCILTFIIPSIDQNFISFFNLLDKTIQSPLVTVRNFCFELVLSNLLSAPNQQDYYEVALKYLLNITSIAPTSFPILITLFKLVAKSGTKTELLLFKQVIAHMFECDFSCIQDVEVSLLFEPLLDDIMDFDKNSLIVFGIATKKGKVSMNTMQIVHNIYKKFTTIIERNSTSDPLVEINKNSIFKISSSTKPPQTNYQFYNKPEFQFVAPKLESVSVQENIDSAISEKVIQLTGVITDFLIYASNDIFLDFLAQFSIYLQQSKHAIDLLFVLISISQRLVKQVNIRTFIQIITQTKLFSSLRTVFEPNNFDKRINFLRNKVLDLIIKVDVKQIKTLLFFIQYEPFLLNEIFLRILRRFNLFSPQILIDDSTKSVFAMSMIGLQASSRPDLNLVRSTNFYFISALLADPTAVNSLFSSSLFISSFLQFAFEPGLLKYTMNCFTKSMAMINCDSKDLKMNVIISFIQNLISTCSSKARNQNYQQLYQEVANSIILSMKYNKGLIQHFYVLLNSFLDYMKASPSVDNVIKCLDFIQVIMLSFISWELSPRQYSLIFSTIRYICNDEPDERIVSRLFSILQRSSFITTDSTSFLIYCPSVLPLILAIHGKSKKNVQILSIFLDLCKYSLQNRIFMHEGYIDYLLIQYLNQNEDRCYVNFRDKVIEFYFDRKKSLKLILELLQQIILSKSSFSTAYGLINLLGSTNNELIFSFVTNLLQNGMNEEQIYTVIPLDSNMPSIQINGVDWNSLKGMFTLNFKLYLDEATVKNFKVNYILFEVFDESNRFMISLKNGAISATFITPTNTTTTFLFRNIFVAEWSQFSIISSPTKDKHKFYNFINKERMPDATIDPINFGKGPVIIRIGGSDFKYYPQLKHPYFGKMYGVSFYPNCLNDDELNLLSESPESFKQTPLFTTNEIQSEMNKQIKFNSITVNLLPGFHRVMHVLDFFCEPLLFDKMINLKNISYGLDFLYYSFLKHPEIQPFFKQVTTLADLVSKNPKYSVYLSLYRFFDIFESQELYNQWFEKLIINISIWAKSDDFYYIILHWKSNFSAHKQLYMERNYFSMLLSKFISLYLNSTPDSKQRAKTTKLFYLYLMKLTKMKFTMQNFDVLIHSIFECKSVANLKDLIEILLSVSTYDVVINNIDEEKLSLLHRVFQVKDCDVLLKMTLCIDNLRVKISNYSMLSISCFILDFNNLPTLVDLLMENLNNHPKILSLLTILSIYTNKQAALIEKIDSNIKSDKPTLFSIIDIDYWYIWPIMLMLNISFEGCDVITKLIATCLSLTIGSDQIDQVFAMMFRMSFFIPRYDMIGELLKKLHAFYEETKAPIPGTVVEYFFIFFFIHIPQELHSRPLLDLFDKSPYLCRASTRNSSIIYNKINIFELEELLNDEFLKFDPQCRISLDDNGKVSNTYYYEIYQTLKTQKRSKCDKRLMEYFIERDKIDPQTQFTMAQNLTNTMDSFKIYAINDIEKTLLKIQKGVLLLITKSKEIVNNSSVPKRRMHRYSTITSKNIPNIVQQNEVTIQSKEDDAINDKPRSNSDINKPRSKTIAGSLTSPQLPMISPQISQQSLLKTQKVTPSTSIVRANLFCSSYCPFRTRIKQYSDAVSTPQFDPQKITEICIHNFNSVIVNLEKRIKYIFSIFNDKFVFHNKNHCKVIPFDKVLFLFERKFANNCGFEIFLYTRKSYLFILQPSEFNEVSSILKSIRFSQAETILYLNDSVELNDLLNEWMIGNMSNFEYLMNLNLLSNHSFKNELIYPVMPPVVSDLSDLKSNPNFLLFDRNSFRKVSLTPVINIKELFVDQLFVQPEFYFDPTIVSNCPLPTWAKTKFEFVYLSRKKLEMMDISLFIDYAFGTKINSAFNSKASSTDKRKLFKKEHPKRSKKFEQPKSNRFPTGKNIDAVLFELNHIEGGNTNLCFTIIFRNPRTMRNLELTEGMAQMKYTTQTTMIDYEDSIFFYSQRYIFGYSRIRSTLFIFSNSSFSTIPLYTENPLFAGLDDQIIFCRDECLLCKMSLDSLITTPTIASATNSAPLSSPSTNQAPLSASASLTSPLTLQNYSSQDSSSGQIQPSNSGSLTMPLSASVPSSPFSGINSQSSFSAPQISPLLDSQFFKMNINEDIARSGSNLSSNEQNDYGNDGNNIGGQNSCVLKVAPLKKFWFADTKITAVAAINTFKIVAFSTIDGFVHVHDLVTTKEISRVNVNYEVKQIVITKNWGFIVAASEEMLNIISVNGEQIKTFKTPFVIDKIFACATNSGFDYIAFSTWENQVGYFEAMYPEGWTKLKKCDSQVVRMTYDNNHRTFVVIEDNGDISLIPVTIHVSI